MLLPFLYNYVRLSRIESMNKSRHARSAPLSLSLYTIQNASAFGRKDESKNNRK